MWEGGEGVKNYQRSIINQGFTKCEYGCTSSYFLPTALGDDYVVLQCNAGSM